MSESPSSETSPKSNFPRTLIIRVAIGILAVLAIVKISQTILWGQSHQETDNAYVTGDLIEISPTVSGTLTELTVEDGDVVKKGQLIAKLDDTAAKARVQQAEANLTAAKSGASEARANATYQRQTTDAAIKKTEAALATQRSRTASARLDQRLAEDTIKAQINQAADQVGQAKAESAQLESNVRVADATLAMARQQVITAQRNAAASRQSIESAKAAADRADRDRTRYLKLLTQDAVTKQQADQAVATASAADAELKGAQDRADAAQSQVRQAELAVSQARAQVEAAKGQLFVAAQHIRTSEAGLELAKSSRTQVPIRGAAVVTNEIQSSGAQADVQAANAGQTQVESKVAETDLALAKVQQAEAALEDAKVDLKNHYLYAPCDGYAVKQPVNVGSAISPGQAIVIITKGSEVWVVGNFKETQLSAIKEGQPVEIHVDTFGDVEFEGKVSSISHATGAATTLIPPDNATGNFTKIVQRVPVKVVFTGVKGSNSKEALSKLRQGMSAVLTITTKTER